MSFLSVLFALSAAFILYVLIGYPAAVAIWARFSPRPILKRFIARKISIVVPVRNGKNFVGAKIQSLLESDYPPELIDLLIVSDGSTDGTDEIVSSYSDPRVRLLRLPAEGKATAVTRGLAAASSDIIVLSDIRQAFDPQALRLLVSCFADETVGVVTGELVIREGTTAAEFNTGLYWKYEKWIRRNLNQIDAMLGATGSIYAIRREAAAAIPAEILLDDVYLPFVAVSRGFRIYLEEKARAYDLPTSLRSEFRRKVRTQAGIYQLLKYFPELLWPGNRRFVHFASHKIGRLLLPFAMMIVAVSSFGLPNPWRSVALIFQGAFYLAVFADPMVPEKAALKRLTAVVRAFTVLLAAAFCAISVFVLPARQLWKETKVNPTV